MKSTITTILAVMCVALTFAQTNVYQPYPSNNASWTVHTVDGNTAPPVIEDWETITWTSDTTINGQTYTRVFGSSYMIGVRQDLPNEKTYYIDDQNVEFDASFDQSAMPGDTIVVSPAFVTLNSYSSTNLSDSDTTTVTSVDSVLINSTYHKTIVFTTTNSELVNAVYICGVGFESATTSISNAFDLACYYVDGYQYWGSSTNPYCTASTLELEEQNIKLYPNPSEDHFYIDFDFSAELKEIHVLDLSGKRIKQFEVNLDESGYDVSNLPRGMYIIELMFDQGAHRTTLLH
ncbi:MAG: T9SS type A sorting domain-containing protein [Flavobacteriales bacterium]|nr:T9SS type A sorting domain-containing protein [Flavobacteriales bacterium]